jgi:hypothetical protein
VSDTFEQIAQVMERALAAIVADLQCERETVHQRLQDVRRRITIIEKIREEASAARIKATREARENAREIPLSDRRDG